MLDFHSQPVSGWMELTAAGSTSEVIEDRPVMAGKQVRLKSKLKPMESCSNHKDIKGSFRRPQLAAEKTDVCRKRMRLTQASAAN